MSNLIVHPIALVGGLETSKATPDPTDFQQLTNWTTFRGRFALRAPLFLVQETGFLDDAGSPAAITHLLAAAFHNAKLYVVGYSSVTQKVYIYECNTDGSSPVRKGTFVWSGVVTPPRPILASFEGGSAASGLSRLYISDFDEQQVTKYWDGTTINTLQVDFNMAGAAEDVKYTHVFPYQFHLWGAGFLEGTTSRKEMLRFSQPGLIPAADPDYTPDALANKEWFVRDFRSAGSRGDKIISLGYAGGAMIIYKKRQMYALFGYDSQSWAIRMLTERSGSVGPYATASTGDGLCFSWGERGPQVTDGNAPEDISESVRKHVLEAEVSDKVVTAFSPDDGLVYFIYPRGGSTDPDRWLAFDKEHKKWSEGEWIATGGGILKVRHAIPVASTILPGPVAAPSSLVATTFDETNIDLVWVNGDLALDTRTEVYKGTASPAATLVTTLDSGVTGYRVSGLTANVNHFFRVRHVRNVQNSAYSNEPQAKTKLTRPTATDASTLSNGIRFTFTNVHANADVDIERRIKGTSLFEFLITRLNQAAATINHDDTTAVLGTTYEYRARLTATNTYATAIASEYSSIVSARAGNQSTLTAASFYQYLSIKSFVVQWSGLNTKSSDMVKIFRFFDGGGAELVATVPHSQSYFVDGPSAGTYDFITGSVSRNVQYRVDLYDDGTVLIATQSTSTTAFNVDRYPPRPPEE